MVSANGIVRLRSWSEDWWVGASTLGILNEAPSIIPVTKEATTRVSPTRSVQNRLES